MKTKNSYSSVRTLSLITLLLVTGSCLDYTVKTTVNRDGSIIREFLVRGDSTDIFNGSLRVPSGDLWKISHHFVHKDKDDTASEKSQYEYRASRRFDSREELSRWMDGDTSSRTVKPRVTLEKNFRWFYTYFNFSEVYPMSFPFQKVPADSFLTEEELSVIIKDEHMVYSPVERKMVWKDEAVSFAYTAADSAEMKRISEKIDLRFQEWMVAALLAEYADTLHAGYSNDPAVNRLFKNMDRFQTLVMNKAEVLFGSTINAGVLTTLADSMLQTNHLSEIYAKDSGLFKPFDLKIRQIDDIPLQDEYDYRLVMPGKVYGTNADNVTSEALGWDFEPIRYFLMDFEMKADSRVANPGIMVLTGLVSVLFAGILFLRRKR
jgi:hypothetical protein